MQRKFIKKTHKINEDNNFTFNKEYEVIADYRKRQSGQKIPDNGFVIIDDFGLTQMVFNDNFIITDKEIEQTYIFNYQEGRTQQ